MPFAAAVNIACVFSHKVSFDGSVVTTGTVFTVNKAAADVSVPQTFVKIARYL